MAKGHTNNPNGRPKGQPNRVTSTIRNWIVSVINNNREQIEKDLQSLEPKDRLLMFERLLPYIMPKCEKADEVEGVCYNKEDFSKVSLFDVEAEKVVLKKWNDNEQDEEWGC